MERSRFYDESVANVLRLTERQIDFLRGTVRAAYRKQLKGRELLAKKFGDDYEPERVEDRLSFIREVYISLGGDPHLITEKGGREPYSDYDE